MDDKTKQQKGGLLRYLGLNSVAAAKATMRWAAPYVFVCGLGMGLMSYGLYKMGFTEVTPTQYVLATGLAVLCVFFTLALLRGLALHQGDNP